MTLSQSNSIQQPPAQLLEQRQICMVSGCAGLAKPFLYQCLSLQPGTNVSAVHHLLSKASCSEMLLAVSVCNKTCACTQIAYIITDNHCHETGTGSLSCFHFLSKHKNAINKNVLLICSLVIITVRLTKK